MGKRSALDKASSLVRMSETAPESPTSSTKSSLLGAQLSFLFSSVPGSSVCGTTQSSIPVDTRDPYSLLLASSSFPRPLQPRSPQLLKARDTGIVGHCVALRDGSFQCPCITGRGDGFAVCSHSFYHH